MRKRLKKKKKLGPFREMGFVLSLTANPQGQFDYERLMSDFVGFLGERGMSLSGGLGERSGSLVIHLGRADGRGEPERRRQAVLDWLGERPEIKRAGASRFFDVNHPPKHFEDVYLDAWIGDPAEG